jgi:uncharacterized membrane-anchored protein
MHRERRRVAEEGIGFLTLHGNDITPTQLRFVFDVHERNFRRHGHEPYLNYACFEEMARTLGSALLVIGLLLTLFLWYRKYKNLEVYPIYDKQKEIYYWTAVLFSNSLGTAFGDFLGDSFGLSYLYGAMVTGGVIIVVVLLHYFTKINHIILFWIAFIFTRPFGATFGDFLTKPLDKGGLYLGTLNSSLVSLGIMGILLFISHRQNKNRTPVYNS